MDWSSRSKTHTNIHFVIMLIIIYVKQKCAASTTTTNISLSTNQFFLVPRFSTEFGKNHLVTWLLQSGMDYLLISDFHPLSTPSNAVWKLTFSNSPSTPLPCCPPSDCQRLWFSIITERVHVINACIIIITSLCNSDVFLLNDQRSHTSWYISAD